MDLENYLFGNEAKTYRLSLNNFIILFSFYNSTTSSKCLRPIEPQKVNPHHGDLDLARGKSQIELRLSLRNYQKLLEKIWN